MKKKVNTNKIINQVHNSVEVLETKNNNRFVKLKIRADKNKLEQISKLISGTKIINKK